MIHTRTRDRIWDKSQKNSENNELKQSHAAIFDVIWPLGFPRPGG